MPSEDPAENLHLVQIPHNDSCPDGMNMCAIIHSYLTTNTDAHSQTESLAHVDLIAHHLVECFNTLRVENADTLDREDLDFVTDEMFEKKTNELWGAIWQYAKQIPPQHPYQLKLLLLLLRIRQVPRPDRGFLDERHFNKGPGCFWNQLPYFGGFALWAFTIAGPAWCIRGGPRNPAPYEEQWEIEEQAKSAPLRPASVTAAEWTNINAFLAQAWKRITDKDAFTNISMDVEALSCAIDALEEELAPSKMDELLPAAAWWFLEAGDKMRTQNKELADLSRVTQPGTRHEWARGKLWRGQWYYNWGRWNFWRQRLLEISDGRGGPGGTA